MKIVDQSFEILYPDSIDGYEMLRLIEIAGRTCYKSEDKITDRSAPKFVQSILNSGHHSVLEHVNVTARLITDRGVSHEIVRHRLAAYSMESSRYANYSKTQFGSEITVIRPPFWANDSIEYTQWHQCMHSAENTYLRLIAYGAKAEEARAVLPNSLKTEIVMTANLREWRHVFSLRCSKAAHPQIRELMKMGLRTLTYSFPVVFDDLFEEHIVDSEEETSKRQIVMEQLLKGSEKHE